MKRIITTAFATMIAVCGYSQTYLPLTAGPQAPLSGDLQFNGTAKKVTFGNGGTIGEDGAANLNIGTNGSTNTRMLTNGLVRYTIDGSGNNIWAGSATFGGP